MAGGGGASNRKLQRSPLKWDGNRTRVCSLTHLSPELNLEAASNPRQHFIGSLVISLPFAASSLQFFPHFHCHSPRCWCFSFCWVWLMNRNACLSLPLSGETHAGRVRCASSAAWLEFVCQYVGQSLCWWLCCSRSQNCEWLEMELELLLPADWVWGLMRGRYCLLPWGICVRASGREETTRILQGLRIFRCFYYCVWLMLQVRWVCMCVCVCACVCVEVSKPQSLSYIHHKQTHPDTLFLESC